MSVGSFKADLYFEVAFNMKDGTYTLDSNIKDEMREEVLGEFLRAQIGVGADSREPADREVFTIRIEVDLSFDRFQSHSNCGNNALRDGILMSVYRDLSARKAS